MSDSPSPVDHTLSFAQREGAAPLPRQLALKKLPKEVTAPLWSLVFKRLSNSMGGSWLIGRWRSILFDFWSDYELKPADEFSDYDERFVPWIKSVALSTNYIVVLGFIEFVIRHKDRDSDFAARANEILVKTGAAYRIIGQSIVPTASPEEAETVKQAFADTGSGAYGGARAHLQNAASALTAGRYADAVRESMNSVESVARVLDPNSTTLAPALSVLEKRGHLHPALKKGFQNLYGYTSDQQGIRHALLDEGEAAVTEADALYMFGSCASFVSYLIRSARP